MSHIYIGSQRIVSKLGDLDSYGADPRRIEYAGTGVDGAKVDYKAKYTTQQQIIKDRYAKFEVPYYGKDNDDYVNGQGFCCDDSNTLKSFSADQNDNPELYQYYYHSDHLGSSSLITNLDGEVVQHIEYVPFGEVFIEERNNRWNTPYLFNAKELDEETGLYYYGTRYYDPRVSIWLSTDPLAEKYPNKTPYHYCSNNPVIRIDPTGLYDIKNIDAGKESKVKTVAVFGKETIENDNVIKLDNFVAKLSGVGVLIVENTQDFADGMAELEKRGVKPLIYAINSHGNDGYFEIGSDAVTTSASNLGILADGLKDKYVFIGACLVTSGQRGKELIQKFSKETSSSVIASDHSIQAGYLYHGGSGLNGWDLVGDFLGLFGKDWNNSYHISRQGGTAKQIFNVTLHKNGTINWNSGNVALPYRNLPTPSLLPSDFNMWNSLESVFPR